MSVGLVKAVNRLTTEKLGCHPGCVSIQVQGATHVPEVSITKGGTWRLECPQCTHQGLEFYVHRIDAVMNGVKHADDPSYLART